ncbi:MAG: hypothetical protein M3R58_04625 [Pseudomonadota bacterium]|nr:hypothetical protein [Pseudomonadota bacterium]
MTTGRNEQRKDPTGLVRSMLAVLVAASMVPSTASAQTNTMEKPSQQTSEKMIADWPEKSKEIAMKMIKQYGPPQAADAQHLQWHNNSPWKFTTVHREPVAHNFPMPHVDMLEQGISYSVPPDKFDDLARYDGSVAVRRTKGEMMAMCDKEEMNFLALNLANDIVTGKSNVDQARQMYGKVAMAFMKGEKHAYTEKLSFTPPAAAKAGDPDKALPKK